MLIWTVTAVVAWLALVLVVVAMCRAAAMGDGVSASRRLRERRFTHGQRRLPSRRREAV